ncbi:MAG: eukaryotic-like serine/threonine-protein kinase [Chloroflexia bacterium]|jgi:serine/threonine-protein kinase|nr:eukaryotic-like serine/threonine-protein kinase [Chloroflexia bacterium]
MSTFPFNPDPAASVQPSQTDALLAGRYLLLEKIGDGGSAEVFRARDERLGRVVALKLLRPQYVSDPTWRRRFEIEARAAAGLSHPNIVDIYDVGEGPDGTLFIAMQYVEGPDLKAVLWKRGRLQPAEVVALSRQVCAALAVAHRSGLVHRDVKPQNILIDSQGNARLTDFGIVKALAGATLTQSGMTFGTAAYLSPEQATGMQVVPASDIYALGCVMYEMLSGTPPFTGDNHTTIAYKQVWEQPRPLHELVPDVPPSLESVVMRCLNKDPGGRYPSAEALSLDFERVSEANNQPTHQVSAPKPTQAGVNGMTGQKASAAGVVPLVPVPPEGANIKTVPPTGAQPLLPVTPGGPQPAVPPVRVAIPYVAHEAAGVRTLNVPRRRGTTWVVVAAIVALLGVGLVGFLALRGGRLFAPGGTGPSAPAPTITVAAQAPAFSPTALVQVAPLASPTASPTVLVALPTDTPPSTEVPPTDTPVPPATDTPVPPPAPTDTPLPPLPTDTPPAPATNTPIPPPPPTDTPVPPAPPAAPNDTPVPPEPTAVVSELERLVDEVIANNPKAVADYLDGKRQALLVLLNDLRERAKDRLKININEAREVLVKKLEELRP